MKKNTVRETIEALLQVYCEGLEPKIPVMCCRNEDGETRISASAVAVANARDLFVTVVEEWCYDVLNQPHIDAV